MLSLTVCYYIECTQCNNVFFMILTFIEEISIGCLDIISNINDFFGKDSNIHITQ